MKKLLFSMMLAVMALTAALFTACGSDKSKGTFYTMKEAYEEGLLTKTDIMSICYYRFGAVYEVSADVEDKGDTSKWSEVDFTPDKELGELDKRIEDDIKTSYYVKYPELFQDREGNFIYGKEIIDVTFYGEYSGNYVVAIDSKYWYHGEGAYPVCIGGTVWLESNAPKVFSYSEEYQNLGGKK